MPATPTLWTDLGQINTTDSGSDRQDDPKVIHLTNGNILIAYVDNNSGGQEDEILGRIFNSRGEEVISEFALNVPGNAFIENDFDLAARPGGGFIVVYVNTIADVPNRTNIILREFTGAGLATVTRTITNDVNDSDTYRNPSIEVNSLTSALVTFEHVNPDSDTTLGDVHVESTIYNLSTQTVGPVTTFFSGGEGAGEGVSGSAIAALSNGNYAVVIGNNNNAPINDEIQIQIKNASGANVSTHFLSADADYNQDPHIVGLSGGGFVVVWEASVSDNPTDSALRGQVFDNAGATVGGTLVPATNVSGNQSNGVVAALADGGFVIAWLNEITHDVRGQRYDAGGTKLGLEFNIDADFGSLDVKSLDIEGLADGRFVVTWEEGSGSDIDVRAKIFDPRDSQNAPPVYTDNQVIGTTGNNVIVIDPADDNVFGHDGNDTFLYTSPGVSSVFRLDGGVGNDRILLSGNGVFDLSTLVIRSIEEIEFQGGNSDDKTIILSAAQFDSALAFSPTLRIDGNISTGADDRVIIDLLTTPDLDISGWVFQDWDGFSGGDRIIINGNAGANMITGSSQSDVIESGGGNDTINAGTGNDTINAGLGMNDVSAGAGDDVIRVLDLTLSALDGGVDIDTLELDIDTLELDIGFGDVTWDMESGMVFNPIFPTPLMWTNFENYVSNNANSAVIVYGTSGANSITTGGGKSLIDGRAGNDTLRGGAGNDTIFGGTGVDLIEGGTGDDVLLEQNDETANDTMRGGIGNDTLWASFGVDVFDGGADIDTLQIAGSFVDLPTINFNINLLSGSDSFGNTYIDIEDVNAGRGNDTIAGDGEANVISGGAGVDSLLGNGGDDTLEGGTGADTLDGGGGSDFASYAGSDAGVDVRLSIANYANNGDAAGDRLSNIENLIGSASNDILFGAVGDNIIEGGAGADFIRGFGGSDTASYAGSGASVDIRLSIAGYAEGGDATGDLLLEIENVIGSAHDDILFGTVGDNILEGGAGGDFIRGLGGSDTASYAGSGAAVDIRLSIAGYAEGGDATGDLLLEIENLIGSDHNDFLFGDAGNNIIEGGAGGDFIRGLGGNDTASYAGSDVGVDIRLNIAGYAEKGHAAGDLLLEIENLIGSDHNDFLFGDAGDNIIEGGAGGDFIRGLGGNDTASYAGSGAAVDIRLSIAGYAEGGDATGDLLLEIENVIGSAHDDFLFGNAAGNTIRGGGGNDFIKGFAGNDVIYGGDGMDSAVFDGNAANYAVTDFGGGKRVVNLTTFEDDRLFEVEFITFSDTTILG